MYHRWLSTDASPGIHCDVCYQCGVACDYPADIPGDPDRQWLIRIGDIRSLIPDCMPPGEGSRLHHWVVDGQDRFPGHEKDESPGAWCDRALCHNCSAKIDLNTDPATVPQYCSATI